MSLKVADAIAVGLEHVAVDDIGVGNIWIEEQFDVRTVRLTQEVILKSLLGTEAGDLEIVAFDFNLRGVAAPFSSLLPNHLLHVIFSPDELTEYFTSLRNHVLAVKNVIQGRASSLIDFRRDIGKNVEGYKLVVIAADLYMLDDSIKESLSILMKAGPSAGVTFLIVSPTDEEFSILRSHCQTLYPDKLTPGVSPDLMVESCDRVMTQLEHKRSDPVLFDEIEDTHHLWKGDSTDGITFSVGLYGVNTASVTMGNNKDQLHNALITGAVGQGKSNLISVILHSMCQRYSPQELQLYLLDFKEGVTLRNYANIDHEDYLPHAVALGLESDVAFGVAVLRHLYGIYEERMQLFKRAGQQNIKQYREHTGEVLARIVVIIDEFQMMFDDDEQADEVLSLLSKSMRLFRAAGIHFILASQTIASGYKLNEDSDVFAQTPIRMAHRNSVTESQATLGLGNTAAADLRMGQAIVNVDYGAIASNKKVSVAWADERLLSQLRRQWWEKAKGVTSPPYVFDGSRLIYLAQDKASLAEARENGKSPKLFVGEEISVNGSVMQMDFSDDAGRNLAILGAGEDRASKDSGHNAAVGILQSAVMSLALQNVKGDAEFIICDLLDEEASRRNNMSVFLDAISQLGLIVEVVDRRQFVQRIEDLNDSLSQRDDNDGAIYLVGFGMDKIISMPDAFGELAESGPVRGVHFLGWWQKGSTLSSHMGVFHSAGFDIKILLHMHASEALDLLGPGAHWSSGSNRALVSDSTYLTEYETVIPYMPIKNDDINILLSILR